MIYQLRNQNSTTPYKSQADFMQEVSRLTEIGLTVSPLQVWTKDGIIKVTSKTLSKVMKSKEVTAVSYIAQYVAPTREAEIRYFLRGEITKH